MKEKLRLIRLIEHWAQHNEEHREKYIGSADQAKKMGLLEVAEEMRLAADKSRRARFMSGLFARAS